MAAITSKLLWTKLLQSVFPCYAFSAFTLMSVGIIGVGMCICSANTACFTSCTSQKCSKLLCPMIIWVTWKFPDILCSSLSFSETETKWGDKSDAWPSKLSILASWRAHLHVCLQLLTELSVSQCLLELTNIENLYQKSVLINFVFQCSWACKSIFVFVISGWDNLWV